MRRTVVAAAVVAVSTLGCGAERTTPDPEAHQLPASARFGSLSPLAAPETAHWGQLAGIWECSIVTPGQPEPSRATWTWRYILDGHAVQDVYVGFRPGGPPHFFGTGLRIYHPETMSWEVSWIANSSPAAGTPRTTRFTATSDDQQIVMRRGNGDPEWRTVFYEMNDATFSWLNEPSGQTMTCTRDGQDP